MAGNSADQNGIREQYGSAAPRYSRTEGIASYRRRRRHNRATRLLVGVFLLAIIGGAGFLLGRQFVDPDLLPYGMSGVPSREGQKPGDVEEAAPVFEPAEIRIMALGDVVMNSSVVQSGSRGETYNFDHLFAHVKDELSAADIRMVSQESALAGSDFGFGNSYPLNAPQDLGRAEAGAGINVVLRATDHTIDTGMEGIHNELMWWHNEYPTMPVLGIAEPDLESNPSLGDYVGNVYIYEKDGFKIAFLNHSWKIEGDMQRVVSPLTEEKVRADVEKARDQGAEMIVACPHWGMEGKVDTSEEETTFARLYADLGVDVVIGTHPRVLQRTEVLEGPEGHKTLCFYSLGCFVSSLNAQNLLGGMADITLARDADGACSVKSASVKALVTNRGNEEEFTTYLVRDYTEEMSWNSWDGLSPQRLDEYARDALGEGYDAGAHELRVV